jgi:short-subunit dehydrogenase
MTDNRAVPSQPLSPRRRAIVIGASSGIGASLAGELASKGYDVAIVARREEELATVSGEIKERLHDGMEIAYFVHDVTDYDITPDLFQRICSRLGGLDLIVYAAAVQTAPALDEYDFEGDLSMVMVNLLGAMAWLNLAAVRFERAGAGHIVAISSLSADRGRRLNPAYHSSKAGLDTYLEALRNRLTRVGVSVTTVKPGFVDTRLLKNTPKAFWVITPDSAARQIVRAIEQRRQVAYVPGRWRYVGLIIRHIPSFIFRRLDF